jgi:hypothetical protein
MWLVGRVAWIERVISGMRVLESAFEEVAADVLSAATITYSQNRNRKGKLLDFQFKP